LINLGSFEIIKFLIKSKTDEFVDRALFALNYIFECGLKNEMLNNNSNNGIYVNEFCLLFDQIGGIKLLEELIDHPNNNI